MPHVVRGKLTEEGGAALSGGGCGEYGAQSIRKEQERRKRMRCVGSVGTTWYFLHVISFKELSKVMGQVLLFALSKMV